MSNEDEMQVLIDGIDRDIALAKLDLAYKWRPIAAHAQRRIEELETRKEELLGKGKSYETD